VLTTGGIPPGIADACSAERVYSALFPRVLTQNAKYYSRFPGDVAVVQRIVNFLAGQPDSGLRLPSGTLLTPRAFQLLGLSGLGSGGEARFGEYGHGTLCHKGWQAGREILTCFTCFTRCPSAPIHSLQQLERVLIVHSL
jgi:hypothetical protein